MTGPYFDDGRVTLHHGDALDVLRTMPDETVDCVVTSPPYFGLRDYGVAGQIGAEATPAEFVAALVAVFEEIRRVLRTDGTAWLNLGDSYSTRGGSVRSTGGRGIRSADRDRTATTVPVLPEKNLQGVPWRVAFALQDAGWILRNDVIWSKPNAMPESVTDRLSGRHEHLFLLTRSPRYWFDLEPIREPYATLDPDNAGYRENGKSDRRRKSHEAPPGQTPQTNMLPTGTRHTATHERGRNPGDVWEISTSPFPGAHFAVMPPEIPRRAILAGCPLNGVVLDPFHGSGTTGMMAQRTGRRYVGIDLNRDYLDLSLRTRLQHAALPFETEGA